MSTAESITTSQPLVSVIIPTHNYGAFIADAIESLRQQTHPSWECVVIDSRSTDDTREVVRRYQLADSRIRYIYQKNRGPSAARNRGIRESSGKYLQFLDADDMLAPSKLETQVSWLEQHSDVDIIYGDMEYFGSGAEAWTPPATPSGTGVLSALVANNITGIHAALVRRDPTILFDEELWRGEDWFYWICLALAGKRFEYLPSRQAQTRLHESSLSKNSVLMQASTLRVRLKLATVLKDYGLLDLNSRLMQVEEKNLMKFVSGGHDLLRIGLVTKRAKWFRYALTEPVRFHLRRLASRTYPVK